MNNTRNSLFRDIPSNWTSIRMRLAAFAPTRNYQQAGLLVYQDDDNYVELVRIYEVGQRISFDREIGGAAAVLNEPTLTATTNLYLRLDRNPTNNAVSSYYSLNGTNWVTVGTVTQTLNNPRLGLVTASSPSGFPNADFAWAEVAALSSAGPALREAGPRGGAPPRTRGGIAVTVHRGETKVKHRAPSVNAWTWCSCGTPKSRIDCARCGPTVFRACC
jgi:hypothetical protein